MRAYSLEGSCGYNRRAMSRQSQAIVSALGLRPHPEGGYYSETFRDPEPMGERGHSTAIYYLLEGDQRSHWHRVDAAEIFHHYRGCSLEIRTWVPGETVQTHFLGPDILAGERPQVLIPRGVWQTARPIVKPGSEDFVLVGCTVAPAFEFGGFEMASPDFAPENM